eukprot:COSAG01_NODE_1594_length_9789_cov_98.477399_5_plen_217_part_00
MPHQLSTTVRIVNPSRDQHMGTEPLRCEYACLRAAGSQPGCVEEHGAEEHRAVAPRLRSRAWRLAPWQLDPRQQDRVRASPCSLPLQQLLTTMCGCSRAQKAPLTAAKAIKAVIDGDNGGEVDHPGTQAHRETYARAVAADKQRAAVYAEATVTAPSAGRKRKARAVDVETESAQLRKQQQKQALAQWTQDVRARIADSQAMMRVSDGGGQVVCEQ